MSSEMKGNSAGELKIELSDKEIQDEQDLLEVLPLAARLAALGDASELDRCHTAASEKFGNKIGCLLEERAREGIWDIRNALGEQLGLSIIETQDFYCLLLHELGESAVAVIEERAFDRLPDGCFIPDRAIELLVNWIWECEDAELDGDAAGMLEIFSERFPLHEEFRLGIVDSPISIEQKEILAALARPRKTFTAAWSEAMPQPAALPLAAASGKPPSMLIKKYKVRKKSPDGTEVVVYRVINENWEMLLDICDSSGKPLRIDLVRAGTRAALPIKGSGGISWKIDLGNVPVEARLSAVFEPLVICFSNHTRLIVNGRSD